MKMLQQSSILTLSVYCLIASADVEKAAAYTTLTRGYFCHGDGW